MVRNLYLLERNTCVQNRILIIFLEKATDVGKQKRRRLKKRRELPTARFENDSDSSDSMAQQRSQKPFPGRKRRTKSRELVQGGFHPPIFTVDLSEIETDLNSEARLTVEVFGNPTPQVLFFHDGMEIIPDNKKYSIISSRDGLYTLIIHRVTDSHDAEYACLARNCVGEAWSFGELSVNVPGVSLFACPRFLSYYHYSATVT